MPGFPLPQTRPSRKGLRLGCLLAALALGAGCGSDDGSLSDIGFHAGLDPAQSISAAPFPNDLYLNENGAVKLKPLSEDPLFATLSTPTFLANLSERIAQQSGFSFASPVFFFIDQPVDVASTRERVHIITLSGPEAGRVVQAQTFWSQHGRALGVMPSWNDYLMPGSTYGVVITKGVKLTSGDTINPGSTGASLFAAKAPGDASDELTRARLVYAPLRNHWAAAGHSPNHVIAATMFTTAVSLPFGEAAFAAVDAFFTLNPSPSPTRRFRYDTASASFQQAPVIGPEGIAAFFGTPTAPFEFNPGNWGAWSRENAAALEGGSPYEGGSLHKGIATVVNGTLTAPALNYDLVDGKAQSAPLRIREGVAQSPVHTLIPFTLYLCEQHLQQSGAVVDTPHPVALYTHGGTASRNSAHAYAVMNCLEGIATVGYDLPFHGGRSRSTQVLDGEHVIVAPSTLDRINEFTGEETTNGPGDYVGDPVGPVTNVGELYGLSSALDPGVVEANLISIATDAYTMTRYLKDGDWTPLLPGLRFDPTRMFHQSQSYGTTFTQALHALRSEHAAVFTGVGSGYIVSANVPSAPYNAGLGSGFMRLAMGLKSTALELQDGAWQDPIVSVHQWLCQRGDAMAYAPYVLRHRQDDHSMVMLSMGNSWDHTLSSYGQLAFDAALGTPVYRFGPEWTLDARLPRGADHGQPFPEGETLTHTIEYGGRSHTAAHFYSALSCHSLQSTPYCTRSFELMYPPVTALPELVAGPSPVCAYQHQARELLRTTLADAPAIGAPGGTCEALYGAP
jgi:hypothetical protein